jgi:outer membrane protein TolC
MFKVILLFFLGSIPLLSQSIEIEQNQNISSNIFTLQMYLSKLLEEDLQYKNRNLNSKVVLLTSLIEQNRYNPDIYLGGEVQAQKTLDFSRTDSHIELEAVGKIHLNMRLYDAQRSHLMGTRKKLFEELSSLEIIDAKEELQLLGIGIYVELLQIQRTIKQYNILLKYQHNITDIAVTRASRGLGGIYDKTQAQNDLINIQLRLSDLKELLIQKEYLFRQAINLESGAPIILQDIQYKELTDSLVSLQHTAIENNARLHVKEKQYELSRSDIKTEADRRGLGVDWASHLGYGHTEQYDSPYRSRDGEDWLAMLSLKYPLYERDDITMQVQDKKIKALQSKNSLEIERRALSRTINRLYNALQKHLIQHQLYTQQKEVLLERTTITYKRSIRNL